MKNRLIILSLLGLALIFTLNAFAARTKGKPSLRKDIQFGAHAVSGKYQNPLESTTVIEDEKTLDDLIGVRKNFQDRISVNKELR